jgi:hypothetical protein
MVTKTQKKNRQRSSRQKAFQFLTVNHGTQARKDIDVMRQQITETKEMLLRIIEGQQKEITELKDLILFDDKPSEKLKIARERLLEHEKEETKQ